jgi:hypothetical protein
MDRTLSGWRFQLYPDIRVVGVAAKLDRQDEQPGEARGSYQSHSQHADPIARQQDQYGTFESLLMISPSEPKLPGRLKLTRRGFDVLGRRCEPVPNDTQGSD